MATKTKSTTPEILRRIPGEIVLAAHAFLAASALILEPHGFPLTHPRFAIGILLPFAVLVLSGVALVQLLRERTAFPATVLMGLAGAWLSASVACRMIFPISFANLWAGGISVGLALVVCSLVLGKRTPFLTRRDGIASAVGLVAGALFVIGLLPPDPTTSPINATAEQNLPTNSPDAVAPLGEEIRVATGQVQIAYRPLLTFDRISPDRFWSLLAPLATTRKPLDRTEETYRFSDGATLTATNLTDSPGIDITAFTPVERDTYSHLNSYSELLIEGCRHPTISFSPTGGQQFDILPAGYPTGLPARFACRKADGSFVVLEAASGEKGPFRQLASGPLAKGDPLVMQFYDNGNWVASLTLNDWSAQVSTALSPSAGWKVPVNAIEFQRAGETGPINVWVTLAATSVGRGWDTVGHAAGSYRNRSQIRWEESP